MELYFVTKNKYKFEEVKRIAEEFGITLHQLPEDKLEDKEKTIEEVAYQNAERFAKETEYPIAVDDTGIFFKAYNNFPGANAKLVYNMIGYEGILKLMEGKPRDAEFATAVAYCEPKKKPLVFEGKMKVILTGSVHCKNRDVNIYERIFTTKEGRRICDMSVEEKNAISHRGEAFRKLFRYLKGNI